LTITAFGGIIYSLDSTNKETLQFPEGSKNQVNKILEVVMDREFEVKLFLGLEATEESFKEKKIILFLYGRIPLISKDRF
jgi:hypothetical protein